MDISKKKKLAASFSIVSNISLTVLKLFAGIISGSLSIVSEAIHSVSDFFASLITYFSVIKSSKPADNDHPYGHGKYEDMAGFIEGILIIGASFFIIWEAVRKIISGVPSSSENILGIAVMTIAVLANTVVSTILLKVSKESNSVSLYADAQHLRTDVYSSFGVLFGLILIKFTKYSILDPVIAILVAVFIYKAGYGILKRTWMNLLDHSLPDEDIKKIKNIIKGSGRAKLKRNSIKTRQVGPSTDIDLILQFPQDTTICECHKICDEIENQIKELFFNCSISIHAEPSCYKKNCNKNCENNEPELSGKI